MQKLLAAALALLSTAAIGKTFNLSEDPESQDLVRLRAKMQGLNCPVPLTYDGDVGEDARGKISRIDCASADGTKKWSLRDIAPPGRPSRIEPW